MCIYIYIYVHIYMCVYIYIYIYVQEMQESGIALEPAMCPVHRDV